MTSVGDEQTIQQWLRLVRTYMDTFQCEVDEAIEHLPGIPQTVIEHIRETLEQNERQHTFRRRNGAVLQRSGPKPWFDDWDPAKGYLWRRLREYLIDQKQWDLEEVDDLDVASDKILSHLDDPRAAGEGVTAPFRVQGLVLGYVQAGKTANYTALIAKAADRGYQLVIVLSGIHNSLRQQTQRRLDLELGLVADDKGVGLPDPENVWWSITNSALNGDFKPGTDAGPLQQGARGIMVVKKNATVLRRLVTWLKGRVPAGLPVLVVDDEADQASINLNADQIDLAPEDMGGATLEEELDPSTINGLIRELLGKFARVSYVAYTATPFANVLIHPDAENEKWGSDLFPRDFIISLDRPTNYVGAERIFGRPALETEENPVQGLDIVRVVGEHERSALVPPGRDVAEWTPSVTPSLRDAILDWLLATAAKTHRMGDGISSMLIHTTPRIQQQIELGQLVNGEVRTIRNEWRYERDSIRPTVKARWEGDFRSVTCSIDLSVDVPFEAIEPRLNSLLAKPEGIKVLVLNSESPDVLDYEADPALKVILVGGNRLSRGLTLEGLVTSFYVRDARAYDTLLQMARWFGFRRKYVDLTRLWATRELVSNFRHLSLVEEDLRDQIKIYERYGLTPEQVAPRIRSHPSMMVTARNRMGSAETVRQSYAGQLLQTFRFNLDDVNWLETNEQFAVDLIGSLGPPQPHGRDPRNMWTDVPWGYIEAFLSRYRTAQDKISFDADTAAKYIKKQATSYGELVTWTVGIRSLTKPNALLGDWETGLRSVNTMHRISRSLREYNSIGALINPVSRQSLRSADEALDLSEAQVFEAARLAEENIMPTIGDALRAQRAPEKGLLLLYPISPLSVPGPNAKDESRMPLFAENAESMPTVVGVALSFPPSDTGATVEYVAGQPGRHALRPEGADDYREIP